MTTFCSQTLLNVTFLKYSKNKNAIQLFFTHRKQLIKPFVIVEVHRYSSRTARTARLQRCDDYRMYCLYLTWANYGPRAKSGPRACLIWPACYYHERVLKSNSLLIVEYSFRFPYRKITFQCPSIRIN